MGGTHSPPPLRSLVGGREERTPPQEPGLLVWRGPRRERRACARPLTGAWVGMALSWVADWASWVTNRDHGVI